jgi:hypothetical protein
MRYYTHYAHLLEMKVSKGQPVKRGDVIGLLGGTPSWSPHLHFEIRTADFGASSYTKGMSKEQVLAKYTDPIAFIKANGLQKPCAYSDADPLRGGFGWMEWADYGTYKTWHPGVDLNFGSGAKGDLGAPIYAVADGVVKYAIKTPDGGWGNHIIIEHNQEDDMSAQEKDELKRLRIFNEEVRNGKVNEFRIDGVGTVYQVYSIPSEGHFNDLGNKWENVRVIPSDWPLDPSQWEGQRHLRDAEIDNLKTTVKTVEKIVEKPVEVIKEVKVIDQELIDRAAACAVENLELKKQIAGMGQSPAPTFGEILALFWNKIKNK